MDILKNEIFKRIYQVDSFDDEVKKLFGRNANECKSFRNYLMSKLSFLDACNEPPTNNPFEKIVGEKEPLYRIKYKTKENNVRTIYFWSKDGNVVLLTVFKEKDHSDYHEAIQLSKSRIKNLKLNKEENQ